MVFVVQETMSRPPGASPRSASATDNAVETLSSCISWWTTCRGCWWGVGAPSRFQLVPIRRAIRRLDAAIGSVAEELVLYGRPPRSGRT